MDPQNNSQALSPQEIVMLQQEIKERGISSNPSQQELAALKRLLKDERTNDQILKYIKDKRQSHMIAEPSSFVIPISENRSSIFKQFAQIKVEESIPQKEYVCKSKRKVKPTEPTDRHTLEQIVQVMDANLDECHALLEKKTKKGVPNSVSANIHESCLWAFSDIFYSSIDRNYFREEPLRRILNQIQLNPEAMTYHTHRMIRQSLPVPKAFNSQFLASEMDRLADARSQNRISIRQRGRQSDLSVGKEVIAVHPVCGHLHTGSILAIYKQTQYMVKFLKMELGTQKVVDILMSPREINSHQRVVLQNLDFEVMALAIRLLQYKTELIRHLKEFNCKAEEIFKSEDNFDNVFYQQYGWIGSTINILSLGIRHVISKFRIRGLSTANQDKVGKNFDVFLINPLVPIERLLNKGSQNSDKNARDQIKTMIHNHKDVKMDIMKIKTDQVTRQLFTKYREGLTTSELQTVQREQMEKLLRSMIGLLVSLRYECKTFSLANNKYLSELMDVIDTRFPQHFNQIYETLHSITGKVADEVK